MGYKQVRIELLNLTEEFASRFSQLPHVEGDRDRDSWKGRERREWLNGLLEAGQFYSPDWAIAVCNGKKYRVNGGHSSMVLASANGHFPHGLAVILRTFHCDEYRDVVELFNHFDNRKSIRTITDKVTAHKAIHTELIDMAPTWVQKALSGIDNFRQMRLDMPRLQEDERTRIIHDETNFIAWSEQFAKHRHLSLAGAMACIFHTYNTDESLALDFWTQVAEESATTPEHPTRKLAKYLVACVGRDSKPAHHDTRAQYAKCVHAWNAWQASDSTELKYHPSKPLPDLLVMVDGKLRKFFPRTATAPLTA